MRGYQTYVDDALATCGVCKMETGISVSRKSCETAIRQSYQILFYWKKQHYVKLDNSTPLRAFFACDGVELKQFGN